MSLEQVARELADATRALEFQSPVAHVYRPLDYAWRGYRQYLERFGEGGSRQRILLVGMNPGPWGMTQTGVPFGSVRSVTEWLGIERFAVERPTNEHPKRPVLGFDCPRTEVSGERVWSWGRDRFGTPERFFERFFIANYCPLLFLAASGRNLTPDKLRLADRKTLLEICDAALVRVHDILAPEMVLGIGVWAEQRARVALADRQVRIDRILHPSPASPLANRGWAAQAEKQLATMGVKLGARNQVRSTCEE